MSMPRAFFLPDGDGFVATEATRGPWSREHQHGGPPTALLVRAIERHPAVVPGMQVARLTVDFLRPVPIARLTCRAEVVRAGRTVQNLTATLFADDRPLVQAAALLIRTAPVPLPEGPAAEPRAEDRALPPPEETAPFEFPFFRDPVGYHTSMEARWLSGRFGGGDAAAWMRQTVPVVDGEAPSPVQRLAVVADSASGISVAVDPARYTFVNADLTLSLHRLPEGEWIGLDAVTTVEPHGVGLCRAALHDRRGPVGRGAQGLVIESRPAPLTRATRA